MNDATTTKETTTKETNNVVDDKQLPTNQCLDAPTSVQLLAVACWILRHSTTNENTLAYVYPPSLDGIWQRDTRPSVVDG
mmetsp:Transcript_14161/g.18460  ORF Transcript_14161/g.18460 Transcript_14161/m.18460 type:complete len:80 (-) Transcript_14161:16-255(-)